jgi:hypothetical protein
MEGDTLALADGVGLGEALADLDGEELMDILGLRDAEADGVGLGLALMLLLGDTEGETDALSLGLTGNSSP